MTGLENILSQISGDAKNEAEQQLAAARAEAEKLISQAKAQAEERTKAILKGGEEKADSIRERADSAAQLERRNAMLSFKQQVIRDAVEKTRLSLENAPDGEYFEILKKLAVRYAANGKAEMRLNNKDLDRLPASFESDLKAAVPNADITISKEPCNIESGFILVYGGIDVNCTFKAVFEDAEGELRDAVGKILFPVDNEA